MNLIQYQQAFTEEELCAGAELVLSGEVKFFKGPLDAKEWKKMPPSYDKGRKPLQLKISYEEYEGKKKRNRSAAVILDEKNGHVLKTRCHCADYEKDHYGCAHTAAALTAWYMEQYGKEALSDTGIEDGLKKLAMVENPFDSGVMRRTDSRILSFLQGSQEENVLPVWKEQEAIRLPKIHMQYNVLMIGEQAYLELKAGVDRMYVVKDLPTLVRCYQNETVYSFGKNTVILSAETCDELANGIMEMLIRAADMDAELSKTMELADIMPYDMEIDRSSTMGLRCFYGLGNSKDLRYLKLDGYFYGKLLHLLDGSELKIEDTVYSQCDTVPIDLDRKGLSLTLSRKSHGINMKIRPIHLVADDAVSLYLRDEEGIFEVVVYKQEERDLLLSLVDLQDNFYIRKSDIPSLYRQIIPLFERCGEVNVRGFSLEQYKKEVPEFVLYLDMEDRNTVSCVPFAKYNSADMRFNLFDNSVGAAIRNGVEENGFAARLVELFQEYDAKIGTLYASLEEEDLFHFLQEVVPELEGKAELYISDRMKRLKVKNSTQLQANIRVKSGNLLLSLQSSGLGSKELQEILSAYTPRKRFHRLKDGSFFDFTEADPQLWDAISDLYQHTGAKDPSMMKLPLYRAIYLQELMKDREALQVEADEHYRQLIMEMSEITQPLAVPEHLQGVLRPYQEQGFHWIARLRSIGFGGILADEMGLGKTLQVLAFLSAWGNEKRIEILNLEQNGSSEKPKKHGRKKKSQSLLEAKEKQCMNELALEGRTLIICPASLVYNWEKEIRRFTPELSAVVIAGNQQQRQLLVEEAQENKTNVWITSYDLLKRDVAFYEGVHFDNEIIDEAQYIKNHTTQASQSVRLVDSDFRLALTGTPIENHLGELWSIMDYLMPGFLYNYSRFSKEYEGIRDENSEKLERLRTMVHPFILRRLKRDVLTELPDKLEESVVVKLEGQQKKLYEAYASRLRIQLEEKDNAAVKSGKLEILAELTRLRQLCCDPSLVVENYQGESAKLDACMELVSQAVDGGHKILLFSQFTTMLDLICSRLSLVGYPYYRIDGSVSKEKRMEMVDSFDYDDVPVFCISLKAGGTGLNLTAADIVIHYDPWWNQAAQNQATDRTHRIGQKNTVTVYELIAEDTIEEQIQNIKQDKVKLMDQVLSGEGISMASLSKEDLLQLL